jgi:hypothetical protein
MTIAKSDIAHDSFYSWISAAHEYNNVNELEVWALLFAIWNFQSPQLVPAVFVDDAEGLVYTNDSGADPSSEK